MSSHPSPDSGGNASQGGLDNIRMIIRRGIYGFTTVVIVCMTFFVWHPWISFSTGSPSTGNVVANRCPGGAHSLLELNLSVEWKSINPNGCRFIYDITQGAMEVSDGEDIRPASGWFEFLPTSARLTSGPIKGYYAYCPTSTGTQPINWDCQPV